MARCGGVCGAGAAGGTSLRRLTRRRHHADKHDVAEADGMTVLLSLPCGLMSGYPSSALPSSKESAFEKSVGFVTCQQPTPA